MSTISNFLYPSTPLYLRREPKGDGKIFIVDREWTVKFDRDGETIDFTIPKEFGTDGPSIPPRLQSFIQWLGPQFEASVVHDKMCADRSPFWPSDVAADVFHEALKASPVNPVKRQAMYLAVRCFGPRWG